MVLSNTALGGWRGDQVLPGGSSLRTLLFFYLRSILVLGWEALVDWRGDQVLPGRWFFRTLLVFTLRSILVLPDGWNVRIFPGWNGNWFLRSGWRWRTGASSLVDL